MTDEFSSLKQDKDTIIKINPEHGQGPYYQMSGVGKWSQGEKEKKKKDF